MSSIPRFYVYILARPNSKPFYVGKGQGRRVFGHDREARSGHKCHKCNVIRKIWRSGGDYQRYIVFTTDNEQEAFDYERELIALHGRENLCNLTDGGEGASGRVVSDERRSRMSVLFKGRKGARLGATNSPEHRQKISAALKGRRQTEEQRQKNSEVHKGIKLSPETIEKIRQKNIGKKRSDEFREHIRQVNLGREISPEHRRKISETIKATGSSRGRKHTPESIEKMRRVQAKRYAAISPTGEELEITHLKTFCQERGFIYQSVVSAINTGRAYRGYFIRHADV